MLQDYKLGLRMLLKYPGLTLAGGLALVIAIGVGAGWYDISGKLFSPTIPLPGGNRLVLIETHNVLTSDLEPRVARDFLEWRRELQTIEELGAYRTETRNLVVDFVSPEPIQVADITAAAFGAAHVLPLIGRALLDSDETPGAPSVVVIGYDTWQRSLGARPDIVGSTVKLGNTSATVIGVMPKDFAYPINHDAWAPLSFHTSYEALEGGAISVIGRLASGVSDEQANAELRVFGERTTAALQATHEHLRPSVRRLGAAREVEDLAQFVLRNLPVLLVLLIACLSVGTLVYARTATREGEIAVRSALGASRARIVGQLFAETLAFASIAAAVGLLAADRAVTWAIANVSDTGGAPFWMTPGLTLSTVLYTGGLAVVTAAMLSLLPALKATRTRVQSHLANLGTGGATLRFGRVWTSAMIMQVALTAIGIPVAMETANEVMRNLRIRAEFPSRNYVAARVDVDRPFDETASAFQSRRALTIADIQRRLAQEPGVVAVTFADRAPGSIPRGRSGLIESSPDAKPSHHGWLWMAVGPEFFEVFERPMVAGRGFHEGDRSANARTVIVNEAFARALSRELAILSPVGVRLRYYSTPPVSEDAATASSPGVEGSADQWFEIVGVVRDLGLDPDDFGDERAFVFHAASATTLAPLVLCVRTHDNPAALAARLSIIAAGVDPRLLVQNAQPLGEWIRQRDMSLIVTAGAQAAITALVLFLSALSIFSLVSVSVSRRTREIGLRAALGANPRQVLAGILSRAMLLMGGGIAAGGALLLLAVGVRAMDEVPLYAEYLAATSAVMLAACLLACIVPARRALRINPTEALREA